MNIDWSKAPQGATHGRTTTAGVDFYKRSSIGEWVYMNAQGQWERAYIISESNCEERPKDTPWNGEGLPPIGEVCLTDHKRREMTVKILAYGDHHNDKCVLVADMRHGIEGKMFGWIVSHCEFRPIRTPEQIAAEEREVAVHEMGEVAKTSLGSVTYGALYALYDAGYRKP